MPGNFRSFAKGYKKPEPPREPIKRGDFDDSQKDAFERVKSRADAYAGKSEGELMSELMKKVGDAKRDGSFNPAEIERFAAQVSPMLGAEQRKRLRELIGMLKK